MVAYAYLRRSVTSAARPGEVSHEAQVEAVTGLARARGDHDLTMLTDWGRSGRSAKGRPGYAQLLAAVRSGVATSLYGYSLSRLARSLTDYIHLAELCREHGVPIRLAKEGELDYSTVTGRLMVNVLASVAQAEAEWSVERANDTIRVRRSNGQHVGAAPYGMRLERGQLVVDPSEDVQAVLDAYREAGSFLGAARRLNAASVPSKLRSLWSAATVRRIVARHEPGSMPTTTARGAKSVSGALLYRLVRCHCGAVMTPKTDRRGERLYPGYYCWKGARDPRHGPPYTVVERKLLPWVKAEAARLRVPADMVETQAADRRQQTALDAKRGRIIDLMADGTITKAEGQQRLASVDVEMEAIDVRRRVEEVPTSIDWDHDPIEEVNAVLRAIWHSIQLDAELRPVSAEWRVPRWRDGS